MSQVNIETTIELIRHASLAVAEPDTSCWPKRYETLKRRGKLPSPLWAHCAPVAYAVRAALGGEIIEGKVKGIRHFWNRLPSGREIDLTSCQFGGDGITPLAKGTPVHIDHMQNIPFAFLWFAHLVEKHLKPQATNRV